MPVNPALRYKILPSLLSANSLCLGDEINDVIAAGADMIHLDVMDNHYAPNLSFGPEICRQIRNNFAHLPIDVHLMISPVDMMIETFAHAGATRLSIHPDATQHLDRSLQLIRSAGCVAGIALNPASSIDCLTWCHQRIDFVLIMTVNPGFSGQTLIPHVIAKINAIRALYPHLSICVDGGITVDNISLLATAGATEFVLGSTIFQQPPYAKTINALRRALQ